MRKALKPHKKSHTTMGAPLSALMVSATTMAAQEGEDDGPPAPPTQQPHPELKCLLRETQSVPAYRFRKQKPKEN